MADEEQVVDAPEEEVAQEQAPRARTQPKKKSGCLGVVVTLCLLVGGGVAALHFTGRLQPLLDKYLKRQDIQLVEPDVPEPDIVVDDTTPEPEPDIVVDDKIPEATPEPEPESPLAAAYRKRYKAPQPGSKVRLQMKSGADISGVIEGIDDTQIHLKKLNIDSEDSSLSIDRSQLAVRSRAMFDEDMFVAYCVLYKQKQDEYAQTRKQTAAKLQAQYDKQARGGSAAVAASKPKPPPKKKVKIQEGEIAAYMRKHGTSDMLAERQKRIQQYERERAREGRDY